MPIRPGTPYADLITESRDRDPLRLPGSTSATRHLPTSASTDNRIFPATVARICSWARSTTSTSRTGRPRPPRAGSYAKRTQAIDGVDIHPHVAAPEDANEYLGYVTKLRDNQKIMATELSLVQTLDEPVPTEHGRRYGFPTGTPVWNAVREAIDKSVPQQQWNDLCSTSSWYEQHKHFLRGQMERFRRTGKLALAS